MSDQLDARAKPPAAIRDVYKRYQKLDVAALDAQPDLVDFKNPASHKHLLPSSLELPLDLRSTFAEFTGDHPSIAPVPPPSVFEIKNLPGLYLYPSLLPTPTQLHLLDTLLLRDLSNPSHKTNLHLHYHVPYPTPPSTYFNIPSLSFPPKDPQIHKPLTTTPFLNRKLRWLTLGGQYDWTAKSYPTSPPPPPFPPDTKSLIEGLFPIMRAEAAIANLYSPGDTLSLHRDVSEMCGQPLASVSIGCDAVFVVGVGGREGGDEKKGDRVVAIRLRSGDALVMSGESRFAWHGVPRVLAATCPEEVGEWPYRRVGEEKRYEEWKGWMKGKRVNLNVRQMFAEEGE